ncbi:hypothetical protein [Cyclobacterium sp. SYSU L10401]|uniref:hypothetical protein n=1 Tax=Cyclobacterium sp. SYSU L10401 TaxID=2678657 RepID=UPI0013D3838C|nr:hypothetical protein [Cyclobacterium sp. SYSU L10401]
MKKNSYFILYVFLAYSLYGQNAEKGLKLFVQSDLVAYTTARGWSAWATAQYRQSKLSLVYVNYPNSFRSIYDETSI